MLWGLHMKSPTKNPDVAMFVAKATFMLMRGLWHASCDVT